MRSRYEHASRCAAETRKHVGAPPKISNFLLKPQRRRARYLYRKHYLDGRLLYVRLQLGERFGDGLGICPFR